MNSTQKKPLFHHLIAGFFLNCLMSYLLLNHLPNQDYSQLKFIGVLLVVALPLFLSLGGFWFFLKDVYLYFKK